MTGILQPLFFKTGMPARKLKIDENGCVEKHMLACQSAAVSTTTTTAVNHAPSGLATYTGLAVASLATQILTLTNCYITTTSHVFINCRALSVTGLLPTTAVVTAVGAGTCTINVFNNDPTGEATLSRLRRSTSLS